MPPPRSSIALPFLLATACSTTGTDGRDAPAGRAPNAYVLQGSGPELYEEVLVPVLFAPWADDLLARARLRPGERVLDVATGTGIVAREAAERVGPTGAVHALDISPAMLDVARRAPAPALPRIEWTEGDALALPFPDRSFDVVLCQQALQFFPDRLRALEEMHRVLVDGGRLVVSVWRSPEHNPYALELAAAVEREIGPAAGRETRSPFAWDDADALSALLVEAGFERARVEAVELECQEPDLRRFVLNDLLAYPATGEAFAARSDAEKEALLKEVLTRLDGLRVGDGWTIPWAANVATAAR